MARCTSSCSKLLTSYGSNTDHICYSQDIQQVSITLILLDSGSDRAVIPEEAVRKRSSYFICFLF